MSPLSTRTAVPRSTPNGLKLCFTRDTTRSPLCLVFKVLKVQLLLLVSNTISLLDGLLCPSRRRQTVSPAG